MKTSLAFIIAVATAVLIFVSVVVEKNTYNDGYRIGKADALRTNPPSDALEAACLSLWATEQNKKAQRNGI